MTGAIVLSLPSPREPKKPLERVLPPGLLGHVAPSEEAVDGILRGFAGLEARSPYRLSVSGRRASTEPRLRAGLGLALLREEPAYFDASLSGHVARVRELRGRHGFRSDVAFGDAWFEGFPERTSELSTAALRAACALGLALELDAPVALLLAAPDLEGRRRELFLRRLATLSARIPTLLVATDDRALESFTGGRLLHQGTPAAIHVHALVTRAAEVAKVLTELGEAPTVHATGSEFSRILLRCASEAETCRVLLAAVEKSGAQLRSLRVERFLPETIR